MNETDQQFGEGERGFTDTARQRALDAYDRSRESFSDVGRRASENIDEAPLIALAGGVVAGALLAALLPRTEAETRVLRPVGERLRTSVKAAASAAKDAGTSRLSDLGVNKEKGGEALRSIFQDVTQAARESAKSALSSSKNNA